MFLCYFNTFNPKSIVHIVVIRNATNNQRSGCKMKENELTFCPEMPFSEGRIFTNFGKFIYVHKISINLKIVLTRNLVINLVLQFFLRKQSFPTVSFCFTTSLSWCWVLLTCKVGAVFCSDELPSSPILEDK